MKSIEKENEQEEEYAAASAIPTIVFVAVVTAVQNPIHLETNKGHNNNTDEIEDSIIFGAIFKLLNTKNRESFRFGKDRFAFSFDHYDKYKIKNKCYK